VTRFALTVSAIELLLIAGVALFVGLADGMEPYLSSSDLRSVGMEASSVNSRRRTFFDAVYHDTQAILREGGLSAYVSCRAPALPEDFEIRLTKERADAERPECGRILLVHNPVEGERDFALRHTAPGKVRAELVRLHGETLLIVRVVKEPPWTLKPDTEAARCERIARLIQERMMKKIGWRQD
jgi:hypothetical protein